MDKKALIEAIVAQLEADLALQTDAAHTARAEATDSESRSEGKYDMRAQTAAYLAAGQARLAGEIARAISAWKALSLPSFAAGERAGMGALMTLESAGARVVCFLGPHSGGMDVEVKGEGVTVVTASSPLGRQLLGAGVGASVSLPGRPKPVVYAITALE